MEQQQFQNMAMITAAYYSKTRDEIIERVRLRDSAMSIFISSISLVASAYGILIVFLGEGPSAILYGSYLLVIICMQCRSSASVISQHHVLIGAAEHFLVTEFEPSLKKQGYAMPQWDSSHTMLDSKNYSIATRSKGHQMLIVRIATVSAIGFIVIQLIFGPHINLFTTLFTTPSEIVEYLGANYKQVAELLISVLATLWAIIAVGTARKTLLDANKKRREYLDNMNKCVDHSKTRLFAPDAEELT